MLAQVIHTESSHCEGPYYYLDCASVPRRAIEAEIFGHVSTDESSSEAGRMGILELAEGGTFHLDNIGELPLQIQGKLLKYIDTGEFKKAGSEQMRNTKVRLLASNRGDLAYSVQRGLFRQELLNRLIVNRIETVPLRYRKEDIQLLVDYLVKEILYPKEPVLLNRKESFYNRLIQYDWPGNVRELQRVIQLILYRNHGETFLDESHVISLEGELFKPMKEEKSLNLERLEHETILKAIEVSGENLSQTAKLLGIGRSTLYRKMERYGVKLYHNDTGKEGVFEEQPQMIQLVTP